MGAEAGEGELFSTQAMLHFVGPPTIPSSTFRQASFPISLPFSLPAAFSNPFSPSLGLFDQGLPLSSRYLCPVLSSSLPGVSSALPSLEPISCVVAGLSFPLRLLPSDPLPGCALALPQTLSFLTDLLRPVPLNVPPAPASPSPHTPLNEGLHPQGLPCRLSPGQPDASKQQAERGRGVARG